jgi:hypothetical protein
MASSSLTFSLASISSAISSCDSCSTSRFSPNCSSGAPPTSERRRFFKTLRRWCVKLLAAVFGRIGLDAVREKLEAMPQPGEVIDKELSRALLSWAKESCEPAAVKQLNVLLLKHRQEFKTKNSAWEAVNAMMRRNNVDADKDGSPHIRGLDYLTLDQLGRLVLMLMDAVFPRFPDDADGQASQR